MSDNTDYPLKRYSCNSCSLSLCFPHKVSCKTTKFVQWRSASVRECWSGQARKSETSSCCLVLNQTGAYRLSKITCLLFRKKL